VRRGIGTVVVGGGGDDRHLVGDSDEDAHIGRTALQRSDFDTGEHVTDHCCSHDLGGADAAAGA
jgi:hypothetical protein